MSDFFQDSHLTAFHKLGNNMPLEKLEDSIRNFAPRRPIALVIPSLYSELSGEALPNILDKLKEVDYVQRIVISLDGANKKEFEHAKKFFGRMPQKLSVIWNDGAKVQNILRILEENDIATGPQGKGRGAWMAFGYVLAKRDCYAIALHDADILTYERDMLARLIFPIVHPGCDFEFSKGYYSRVSTKMHGRVTRLMYFPLVHAISHIIGKDEFIRYLRSFRYPLAGEFAIVNNLVRRCRLPFNWGLEIGVLSEVYRNSSLKRICQVDLADEFDHKHSELDPQDLKAGLAKMAVDIMLMIFSTMSSMGHILSQSFLNTLNSTYVRFAQDFLSKYYYDSLINGLEFDRHSEGIAIETFSECLHHAGKEYLSKPMEIPTIPTWNRVVAAVPNIFLKIEEAVDADNN
jgi:glucosyl-3-phosphoglycerate synthase